MSIPHVRVHGQVSLTGAADAGAIASQTSKDLEKDLEGKIANRISESRGINWTFTVHTTM